jgi:hypothetical protein
MLLYTEKQLDVAYRIDCKARTLYESLLEAYMIAYNEDDILGRDIPEYLIQSVNDLLQSTITIDI